MRKSIELTILMPCLNEEKTLEFCINEAKRFISESGVCAEILVADNGSTDNSVRIARSLGVRIIHVIKKGYGSALRCGIKAAHGKYIIMGDCDMSYDFYHLGGFLSKLRSGSKLVMGNRFKGGIEEGAMPPLHKYFGVPLLSFLGRVRFGTFVGDFHCGLRGFEREAAQKLNLRCDGMEFATEIIGRFVQSGAKISEIPTVLRKDGRNGKGHLRSIPDGMRHLLFMIFM